MTLKTYSLFAFLLLAILGIPYKSWTRVTPITASASRPQRACVQVSTTVQDLGEVSPHEPRVVVFSVHNPGQRRVVLNEGDEQCGCTDAVHRTVLVPPGQSIDLPIIFRPGSAAGHVEKISTFTTNDPSCPQFTLTVRALVREANSTSLH